MKTMKLSELTQSKPMSGGSTETFNRDKSILRQVAFKGAVELFSKESTETVRLDSLLSFAEKFEIWLNRPL